MLVGVAAVGVCGGVFLAYVNVEFLAIRTGDVDVNLAAGMLFSPRSGEKDFVNPVGDDSPCVCVKGVGVG